MDVETYKEKIFESTKPTTKDKEAPSPFETEPLPAPDMGEWDDDHKQAFAVLQEQLEQAANMWKQRPQATNNAQTKIAQDAEELVKKAQSQVFKKRRMPDGTAQANHEPKSEVLPTAPAGGATCSSDQPK